MKKLIVCGASGRMGSLICKLAQESKAWEVVGKVDLNSPLENVVGEGDVIIDFSQPEGTALHVALALKNKKPIVIGTTGLNAEQQKKIEAASKKIPIVFSPNMSVGVNVLFRLTEIATKAFGKDYKIEISETHHVHKKDAPSGTAKEIGNVVEKNCGAKPPIESIREGEVIGDHTVVFKSGREHLAITHRALDRSLFAEGALKAAAWVIGKNPRLYSMADVLEL